MSLFEHFPKSLLKFICPVRTQSGELPASGAVVSFRKKTLIITANHAINKTTGRATIQFPSGDIIQGVAFTQPDPKIDFTFADITNIQIPPITWKRSKLFRVLQGKVTIFSRETLDTGVPIRLRPKRSTMNGMWFHARRPLYYGESGAAVISRNNRVLGVVYGTHVEKGDQVYIDFLPDLFRKK